MNDIQRVIEEIKIDTWKQFRDIVEDHKFNSWAFRGQADKNWQLFSSLSRYFHAYKIHPKYWMQQEERILRIFKRKAYKFLKHIPDEDNSFEWLALMQHYGAPTRLIDFTWSPYVAAFFALERATEWATIWAIFPPKTTKGKFETIRATQKQDTNEKGPWIKGNYEKYFLPNQEPIVVIGEPVRMNQRLIAQSGTFAVPGILDKPIESILAAHEFSSGAIIKLTLHAAQMRRTSMENLYRMNITNATLFPDLNGLARSLALELEYHWAFDPVEGEENESFFTE